MWTQLTSNQIQNFQMIHQKETVLCAQLPGNAQANVIHHQATVGAWVHNRRQASWPGRALRNPCANLTAGHGNILKSVCYVTVWLHDVNAHGAIVNM